MSNEERNTSFREFLDRSSKLLTVFGVINGLAIYTAGKGETGLSLSLLFWIMSLFVWWEILAYGFVIYTNERKAESWKFSAFILLLGFAQLQFIKLFYDTFPEVVLLILAFGFAMGLTMGLGFLLVKVHNKYFKSVKHKTTKTIIVIILFILFIELMFGVIQLVKPYARKIGDSIKKQSVISPI